MFSIWAAGVVEGFLFLNLLGFPTISLTNFTIYDNAVIYTINVKLIMSILIMCLFIDILRIMPLYVL